MRRREFLELSAAALVGEGVASPRKPFIYLAVDDPPLGYMSDMLESLERHGANATFFCIGKNIENDRGTVVEAVRRGYAVGNHSYRHPNFRKIGYDDGKAEIEKTDAIIAGVMLDAGTDIETHGRFFRFPYELYDHRFYDRLLPSLGYRTYKCDVDTKDWAFDDGLRVEDAIRLGLEGRDGSIVVCHDYKQTAKRLLPELLKRYTDMGFGFGSMRHYESRGDIRKNHVI